MENFPHWETGNSAGEKLFNGKMLVGSSIGQACRYRARVCKSCQKLVGRTFENNAASIQDSLSPEPCPHCGAAFGSTQKLVRGWIHQPIFGR